MPEKKPRGWMVCISMETREAAEKTARAIESWRPFLTHLRPIFTGDDGLEAPGPRIWERTDGSAS